MFPNAAAANRSIFYDRAGSARSVSEVYSVLTSRYAGAANSSATRTAMAAVGDTPATTAVASAAPFGHADGQRRLSVERSRMRLRRDVTPVTVASASATADGSTQADTELPLAVPGRRAVAAGLAGGPRIVGRILVADVGRELPRPRSADIPTSARRKGSICSATAAARSAASQRLRHRSQFLTLKKSQSRQDG